MEARIEMMIFFVEDDEVEQFGLSGDPRLEDGKAWIYFKFFDGVAVECDEKGNVPNDPIILTYPTLKAVHLFSEYEKCLARWNVVRADELEPYHVAQHFARYNRLSNILKGNADNGITMN